MPNRYGKRALAELAMSESDFQASLAKARKSGGLAPEAMRQFDETDKASAMKALRSAMPRAQYESPLVGSAQESAPMSDVSPGPPYQPSMGRVSEESTPETTVGKGDNLWNLAKRLYGDGNKWKQLYELNKDIIGDNPNLIQPGMKLRLR